MNLNEDRELAWQLRRLRIETSGMRSSAASREQLLAQFSAKHAARRPWLRIAVPAAVAAALLLSVGVMRSPKAVPVANAATEEASEMTDGFIAVPFVPPLAQGESVSVIHTELHPAALARMGVNVDPAWTGYMPADLLVGEDGSPRAVRISSEDSGDF